MTHLIHHTWLQRSFAILAIAALLFTAGSSLASAKPANQATEKELDKALCDMMGGDWWEDGSNYTCYFDDWYLVCENDGADCQIFCDLGRRCERIINETRRQASLADDQKVVEPATTPTPSIRDRGRSTTADEPMVVEPATTPTPTPRGRGRTTIADQPVFVAPISTPTPSPITIESPTIDPTPVMIDPA